MQAPFLFGALNEGGDEGRKARFREEFKTYRSNDKREGKLKV
jgi:hypothetical protein